MTKIKWIAKLIIFALSISIYSCKQNSKSFDGEVFKNENDKFGYTIFKDKKRYIKQEFIPLIGGNIPFKDSIDAQKTMNLVLEKLNSGHNPSLNDSEIEHLNLK